MDAPKRGLTLDSLNPAEKRVGLMPAISVNQGTGYGQFSPKHGFQVQTHRYSYELANGPIPEKHDIHHTCHVRRCCNPSHLRALSRSDNLRLRKVRRIP